MASLSGYQGNISGTTGATNVLEPKASYRVYILPRGAHAASSSTGSLITFDSAEAAARFTALQWIQVGTDGGKVRQVTAVGGTSMAINTAVTVAENDRIFLIGSTQPSISGSSATYQPLTTIRGRDDDQATPLASSLLTTDANGGFQFFAGNNYYDALIQDANVTNVGSLVDINIGMIEAPFVPVNGRSDDIGTAALPWDDIVYSGRIISAVSSSTGTTSHKFDTASGITAGSLFHFASNGSVKVYGDSHGGVFQSWSLPEVVNAKSAKYGAKGDGSTDDTLAIQAALDDAGSASNGDGGICFLPPGIYIVNSQLTVPDSRCIFRGSGDRVSVIKPGSSFVFNGTTMSVVRLGDGTGDAYCSMEHINVDCDNKVGSIGVYSTNLNEKGGIYRCVITNYGVKGVFMSGSGVQNIRIDGIECLGSPTVGTTSRGIDIAQSNGQNVIFDATVNINHTSTRSTGYAIGVSAGGNWLMERIHVEKHDVGLLLGTNSTGVVNDIGGQPSIFKLAVIDQPGWLLNCIATAGATHAVQDTTLGVTLSSINAGSWYWKSNDGPSDATKSVFTSTRNADSILQSPTLFGTTLTANGAVGFSGALTHRIASVTAGLTVDVSGRNTILFTAGSSQVHTFVGGEAGQRVRFIAAAGATFFRGNTLALSAANVVLGANDVIDFTCLTGGVSWVQSGLVDNGAFA